MENGEILEQLSSSSPHDLLMALETLFVIEEENQVDPKLIFPIYHILCNLLIHNHYKIRCFAFQHLLYFLDHFIVFILSTEEAIPNIITTLKCCQTSEMVKSMVGNAQQCLIIIFDVEEPKVWWPLCEKVLLHSKSNTQRVRLLEALLDHGDEIPVRSILQLLTDTAIQVQRYAYEMIQMCDPAVVEKELKKSKKFLGLNIKRQPNPALKGPLLQRKSKERNRISESERRKRMYIALQELEKDRIKQHEKVREDLTNFYGDKSPIKYKSRITHPQALSPTLITLGSPKKQRVSLAGTIKPKQFDEQQLYEQLDDEFSHLEGDSLMLSRLNSINPSILVKNDPYDFRELDRLKQGNTPAKLKHVSFINEKIPDDTLTSHNEHLGSRTQPLIKIGLDSRLDAQRQNLSSDLNFSMDKSLNKNSELADDEAEVDAIPPPPDTSNYSQMTLRNQINDTVSPYPHPLIDMTQKSWQFRQKYLTEMHEALTSEETLYDYRADFLMDCALTAATPPNKHVAPILANVISDLMLSNPEIINLFLREIINFLLISQKLFKPDSTVMMNLIGTLFLEVEPSHLIMTILDFSNLKTTHPEQLILATYRQKPETRLTRPALFKLVGILINEAYPLASKLEKYDKTTSKPVHMDAITELFQILSNNQPKMFASVVNNQSFEAQKILKKFIVNENDSEYKKIENASMVNEKITNQTQAMNIVFEELRHGSKCNLNRLANALEKITIRHPRQRFNIFLKVLTMLSKLSNNAVLSNDDLIRRICFSHFTSAKLFEVFDYDGLTGDMINGMARFVWSCPKHLLKSAASYYPQLYHLFKRANGTVRTSILSIVSAIEQSSGKLITDLEEMDSLHKTLFERNLRRTTPKKSIEVSSTKSLQEMDDVEE